MVNYTYNAWGEIISTTGTLASTIGAVNKLRYRSYYYDTETGFYYLQSRYYDPIVKRFISPDSTDYLTANGDFDGYNLYAYCVNNPVMYVDSTGTIGLWALFHASLSAVFTAFVYWAKCEMGYGKFKVSSMIAYSLLSGSLTGLMVFAGDYLESINVARVACILHVKEAVVKSVIKNVAKGVVKMFKKTVKKYL